MKKQLQQILKDLIFQKWGIEILPKIEIPSELSHGDYTSNVAMILAKNLKTNPIVIAKEIVHQLSVISHQSSANRLEHSSDQKDQKLSNDKIKNSVLQDIDQIEVKPPGFINFYVSASSLSSELVELLNEKQGVNIVQSSKIEVQSKEKLLRTMNYERGFTKKMMVEFAHPNTHKAFHIGHLRNITTGESIVRLLESQGIKVIRANYQGDVGMHIAKCLYGILHDPEIFSRHPELVSGSHNQKKMLKQVQHDNVDLKEKVELLGKAYAAGSKAYEADEQAKKEIGEINKKIYAKDQSIWELYQTTRKWSLEYFENIYKRVGSHYDRYYFESETYQTGKKYVMEGFKKGIFVASEGAIIFPGEKFGLHNRVFITGEGNPTYEGKDMGLARLQFDEYQPDKIIHVVGPEQAEYFKVVFEALAQFFPDTKGKEYHLIYGWVKLKHGKMSSRSGNVVLGEWLIEEAKKEIYNILSKSKSNDTIKLSAFSHQPSEKDVILSDSEGSSCHSGQTSSHSELDPESHLENNEDSRLRGNDIGNRYSDIEKEVIAETAAIAAVKYSFLKVSTQQEIAFDIEESVNFQGDSGPYLLYTYARCKSVIRKSDKQQATSDKSKENINLSLITYHLSLNNEELTILRLIHQFPEIVESSAVSYAPNILCKYLFELSQAFNVFYNRHSILGSHQSSAISNQLPNENQNINLKSESRKLTAESSFRLSLTSATALTIKKGLYLLGIDTLEKM